MWSRPRATGLSFKGFFSYRPRRLIVTQPVQHGDDVVRGHEGIGVVGTQEASSSLKGVFSYRPRRQTVALPEEREDEIGR